jgi:thymidylate synthase (FAD)
MRNLHTSPFEQVILTFHAKMPVFVARQWVRHRTARLNEMSGRYSVMSDEFYVPEPDDIRYQSKCNRQGGSEEEVPPHLRSRVLEILKRDQAAAYASYREMLTDDIARELARINLPLSLYTQWYWQIDLHNLFQFLRLRLDPHAQKEIRAYAEAMAKMARAVAPLAFGAFEEHVLFSVRLSRREAEVVRSMIRGEEYELDEKGFEELTRKLGL